MTVHLCDKNKSVKDTFKWRVLGVKGKGRKIVSKQSLFISYCWKDGNVYADELETQLSEVFEVKRDKSQLIVNDDLYDFMKGIADCDNVIIVLTAEYVKSINCMLEMSYLFGQADWDMKAMVLVIDDSLYSIERKLEVLTYWNLLQQKSANRVTDEVLGNELLSEQKEYIDQICDQLEGFLKGVSRRKNPSQIAIVSEIIKKAQKRDKEVEERIITNGEEAVLRFLEENGQLTLRQLSESTNYSQVAVRRYIQNLISAGKLERVGSNRTGYYKVKAGQNQ